MCNITRDTSTCEKQYKSLIALHQQSLTEDKAHLIFNNDCVKSWWIIPLIQEDKIKLILVSRNAMIYSKQHTTAATSNSMYEYYRNFCLLSPWHALHPKTSRKEGQLRSTSRALAEQMATMRHHSASHASASAQGNDKKTPRSTNSLCELGSQSSCAQWASPNQPCKPPPAEVLDERPRWCARASFV